MVEPRKVSEQIIAVYRTHTEVERAIDALRHCSGELSTVTIIGRDYPIGDRPVGFTGYLRRTWPQGELGTFWSSLRDRLTGSATALVPEIGHIMIVGSLVDTIEEVSQSGNRGIVAEFLVRIGVSREQAPEYESALKAGRFLLFVSGPGLEFRRIHGVLAGTCATCVDIFTSESTSPTFKPLLNP